MYVGVSAKAVWLATIWYLVGVQNECDLHPKEGLGGAPNQGEQLIAGFIGKQHKVAPFIECQITAS